MKQFVGLALALVLSSCGFVSFPKSVQLGIGSVILPTTVGANEAMTVSVRYSVGCGDFDQRLVQTARTANTLSLSATARNQQSPGTVCPAIYIERTLEYTDPGTPARTSPFEVIVNGKNWGNVGIR